MKKENQEEEKEEKGQPLITQVVGASLYGLMLALHNQIRERVEACLNADEDAPRYQMYEMEQRALSLYVAHKTQHVDQLFHLATLDFSLKLEDMQGEYASPAITCQVEVRANGDMFLRDVTWRPAGNMIKLS